jgi:SAM-dependent MidA family methyltransferase
MNRAPYTRVGLQDITAHIDLTATTHAAEAAGLSLLGATRQRRFLTRLGAAQEAAAGERGSRSEQWAARAALGQILDPHGLGRLAVLIFGRDATASALRGLSPV